MQVTALLLLFFTSACFGRRLYTSQPSGSTKPVASNQHVGERGKFNQLKKYATSVLQANAAAAFHAASLHMSRTRGVVSTPLWPRRLLVLSMIADDGDSQGAAFGVADVQTDVFDPIAIEELGTNLELESVHEDDEDDEQFGSDREVSTVHEESKKRVAESMSLLNNFSEEMHPGHCQGRFYGPGPEFEGMEYDDEELRWRIKPDEGNGETGVMLQALDKRDVQLATKYESEGGTALLLSSAWKRSNLMRDAANKVFKVLEESKDGNPQGSFEELARLAEDAVSFAGLIPGKTVEGWMQDFHNATLVQQAQIVWDLAIVLEEKEALSRTVWSDVEFHEGDEGNRDLVRRLEMQFAHQVVDTINTYIEYNQSYVENNQSESSRIERNSSEKNSDEAKPDEGGIVDTDVEAPESKQEPQPFRIIDEEEEEALFGLVLADDGKEAAAASLATVVNPELMNDTLWEARNLGVAIDLVGAYLKNYEIDKADALITRVMPLCRDRGGAWVMKGLDKLSTVRMKQQRHHEALEMMREMESIMPYKPEESWEFYDILYRNLAWAYTAIDDTKNTLKYTKMSVEIKKKCGIPPTWFDIWDLGTTHSRLGQETNQREEMRVGHALCQKAAEIHQKAEPSDKVMLAKIHMSVGEIAMGIGDTYYMKDIGDLATEWYQKAEPALARSHELMTSVLGPLKPLAGWSAGNLAHCMVRLERWEEARDYLKDAFRVEATKDATTPGSVRSLIERLMNVHNQLNDAQSMCNYVDDIDLALAGLRDHGWDRKQRYKFAVTLQKSATAFLMADNGTGDMLSRALKVLREAEEYLLALQRDPQAASQEDIDATLHQIQANINILAFSEY